MGLERNACLIGLCCASALAFGGMGGAVDPEHDECDKCVCANDRGTDDDPNDKKCCPTEPGLLPSTWTDFCDVLVADVCKAVCTNDKGEAITRRESTAFESRSAGGSREGGVCGDLYPMYSLPCARGLYCVFPTWGGKQGTCMTFQDAVTDALAPVSTVSNVRDNCDNGGVDFDTPTKLSSDQLQGLTQQVSERLNTNLELLSSPDLVATDEGASASAALLRRRQLQGDTATYTYTWALPADDLLPNNKVTCLDSFEFGVRSSGVSDRARRAEGVVSKLRQQGVRLLDFDWDKTANTVHTYQQTYSSFRQIANLVSQDYIEITNQWCRAGLPSHIVTYNDANMAVAGQSRYGPDVIHEVLDMVLGEECKGKIKVFARNDGSRRSGKNCHIAASMSASGITDPKEVALFDDTEENIVQGLPMGYRTVWVYPKTGFVFSNVDDYKDQCPRGKSCRGRGASCSATSIRESPFPKTTTSTTSTGGAGVPSAWDQTWGGGFNNNGGAGSGSSWDGSSSWPQSNNGWGQSWSQGGGLWG